MTTLEVRQKRGRFLDRVTRFVCTVGMVVTMTLLMAIPAFAANDASGQISTAVSSGLKKAYDLITSIIMPIGAICFAVAALKMMFGSRRGMEEGQNKLLTVLLVLAGVYLAPIIIQEVGGWFSNVSSSTSIWGS